MTTRRLRDAPSNDAAMLHDIRSGFLEPLFRHKDRRVDAVRRVLQPGEAATFLSLPARRPCKWCAKGTKKMDIYAYGSC